MHAQNKWKITVVQYLHLFYILSNICSLSRTYYCTISRLNFDFFLDIWIQQCYAYSNTLHLAEIGMFLFVQKKIDINFLFNSQMKWPIKNARDTRKQYFRYWWMVILCATKMKCVGTHWRTKSVEQVGDGWKKFRRLPSRGNDKSRHRTACTREESCGRHETWSLHASPADGGGWGSPVFPYVSELIECRVKRGVQDSPFQVGRTASDVWTRRENEHGEIPAAR